jgi:RHS repeat-associated protein
VQIPGSHSRWTKSRGLDTTDYGDNALGERTSITPPSGPDTALTYSQDGALASYTKGGTNVTYSTDGNGERAAASGATTATYTWNTLAAVPQLLDDSTTSYLYGPTGVYEQIKDSDDTATYLNTDQAGSPRLLTDSSGTQTGSYTYSDYGTPTHTGTATTTLGYDGEYTDLTTGYLYLQARYYDPTTAQFLTRDPLEDETGQPYSYAGDDPLDNSDPTGLFCVLGHNPNGSCRGSSEYDTAVTYADPVSYALPSYYKEYQAAASGCSISTDLKYGLEGTGYLAIGALGPEDDAAAAAAAEGSEHWVADVIAQHAEHEIPGVTEQELPDYVRKVMSQPGYNLRDGRTAWWDPGKGAVVIREGNGGTVMVPSRGYAYFQDLIQE